MVGVARLKLCETRGVLFQQLETGERCGAAQGIGGEAVAVEKRFEGFFADEALVEALAGHRDAHGQEAAGQPLRQGHQIGFEPGLFRGEQSAGAAEPRHHFIGDQQAPMAVHALLHGAEKFWPHQAHS